MLRYNLNDEIYTATEDVTAAYGILEAAFDRFEGYTCEGILKADAEETGKSREEVAVAWMEKNFDALSSVVYACWILSKHAMTILQEMPEVIEAPKRGVTHDHSARDEAVC